MEKIRKELEKMVSKELGFGKRMTYDLYIHRMYESEVVPSEILEKAKKVVRDHVKIDFEYTVVKWNVASNAISFIYSPNFDTADEPLVGDSVNVNVDGSYRTRSPKVDQIYHHKWQMVKPNYPNFDYNQSKGRSLSWYKQHDYDSRRIGYKKYWDELNI